ncbi:sensor histidine kinase [Allokutzneria albata]|uniref:histidine kinase n=1 Tax=Allokutzneria albata TaxID=211114 RepID=A0A1H0BSC9_ALLAB|nr:histidine kinase [Allokutzneria albata]SDN48486.1 Histidine kinase [Allokutzneria albata]
MTGASDWWLRRSPVPPWALGSVAAMLVVVVVSYEDMTTWAFACALLAPSAATVLLAVRPLAALGVCVVASLGMSLAVDHSVPPWSVAFGAALGVISFLVGRRTADAVPALVVFGVGAGLAGVLGSIASGAWASGPQMLAMAVVLPWWLGRGVRQQAELAAADTERAHLRERARIAHDMHDVLGHELSLLALRAGALELAPDLPERHRAAIAALRAGAGQAIERLADIVGVLRDREPAPLHPASDGVEDLVDRAVGAGMTVSLEWDGPRQLPEVIGQAAHRVVQEALTNAMKHAPAAAVRVRLAVTGTSTEVTVTNEMTSASRRVGGRVGLAALEERVRFVGGTFRAGPVGRTFEVVAALPHPREP